MSQAPHSAIGLFIGIDWSDQYHDYFFIDANGNSEAGRFDHGANDIESWLADMQSKAGDGMIAIHVQQQQGPLAKAHMFRANELIYAVNLTQVPRHRVSSTGGQGHSDPPRPHA